MRVRLLMWRLPRITYSPCYAVMRSSTRRNTTLDCKVESTGDVGTITDTDPT